LLLVAFKTPCRVQGSRSVATKKQLQAFVVIHLLW